MTDHTEVIIQQTQFFNAISEIDNQLLVAMHHSSENILCKQSDIDQ